MRLSEIINQVRVGLKDTRATRKNFEDADLARFVNEAIRSAARTMIEADSSYCNHTLELSSSSAVLKSRGRYEYRLPRWVMNVTEVRITPTSSQQVGERLERMKSRDYFDGWMYERTNLLRLHRSEAEDLTLQVAKLPARLTLGTLPDQTGVGTNEVRLDLDSAATTYPHETEANAYANGVFEITTAAKAGTFLYGASSSAGNNDLSDYYTRVTMDAAPGTATGDTYEMHSEIPDEHMRYVILMATLKALQLEANQDSIQALMPELSEEARRFKEALQPRQTDGPISWSTPGEAEPYARFDLDRNDPNHFV